MRSAVMLAFGVLCLQALVEQSVAWPLADEDETAQDVTEYPTGDDLSIDSIKRQLNYDDNGDDDDDDDPDERGWCAICHSGFRKKPEIQLACGHSYHESCLIDHFQANADSESDCNCFLCKKPLRLKNGALFYNMLPHRTLLFRNRIRLGHRSTGRVPFDFENPGGVLNELARF